MNEIRKGHPKWEKLIAEWEQMKRPSQMTINGSLYVVLQDAITTEFFFKKAKDQDFYESLSWGG